MRDGSAILFVDEFHTIVGAGAAEGAIDAASILKPVLARGELQLIGATTDQEFRTHIQKDAALERRFGRVQIEEPTPAQAAAILEGLAPRYERYHSVHLPPETLREAVELSVRYLPGRFLPDKAIDLMDEAASRVRLRVYNAPPDMKKLRAKLETLLKQKEEAVSRQDYETAAAVRDEEMELRASMESIKADWEKEREDNRCTVTAEDIAEVVNAWTGIPVSELSQSETDKLLHLEQRLHERIIGQDEAVSAVSRAIRRARAGLKDPSRPIGSFIFLGPTGVGKTELARALSSALFSDESAMIRLDMSEYMEPHSVSKLIGSPPGYVGYGEGGQLTERVRRKPYCVILFDEIEKAHADVFNILLQVLEDGRLTDSGGRSVDFRNTVIIMTSNAGAQSAAKASVLGFGADRKAMQAERTRETMMNELKRTFKPEFLNRVDEIVLFAPLEQDQTLAIAKLMLKSVAARLKERNIELIVTDDAARLISSEGFDPEYGARPLRRAIQQRVEDALSEEILSGKITIGDTVKMEVIDDKLAFTRVDI